MNVLTKTGHQSDESPFTFVMSHESKDRHGDVVVVDGIDTKHFKKNPIALGFHNYDAPIGRWENIRVEGKKLLGDLVLAAKGTSAAIDEIRSLIEQKIIRAVSIGFSVKDEDSERFDEGEWWGGSKISKCELLECSIVSVGANRGALLTKSLRADTKRILGIEAGHSCAKTSTPPIKTASQLATPIKPKGKPMSISDKIVAAQTEIQRLKDVSAGIVSGNPEGDFSEQELMTIEEVSSQVEALIKKVAAFEKVEKTLSAKSIKAAPAVIQSRKTGKPEDLIFRLATVHSMAKQHGMGLEAAAQRYYSNDEGLNAVIKTAVAPATTSAMGWARELVTEATDAYWQMMRPVSALAAISQMGRHINFNGRSSVTIPSRGQSSTTINGAFVGEVGVIPVVKGIISGTKLSPYKAAAITTLSKELDRSAPATESILREMIIGDVANLIDSVAFGALAQVTGVQPAGLLHGVTGTASAGTTLGNIITDITVLYDKLLAANPGARPVFLMNTKHHLGLSMQTSATGTFMFTTGSAQGLISDMMNNVIVTPNIPAGTVIALDANSLVTGYDAPIISVSDTTALTMANADHVAPTQALDGTGALGVAHEVKPSSGISLLGGESGAGSAGAEGVSMFQTDCIAIKNVTPVSWGNAFLGTVATITGVAW